MSDSSGKTSPLHIEHERLGGRLIEFGGWTMPVQFSSIVDEHLAVRKAVGIFDISHMGQFFVSGAQAEAWLNQMLANNIAKLSPPQGQYTFLLNEKGGIIDDLIVYRLEATRYLLIVNAACIDRDREWMQAHLPSEGVQLEDLSADYAGIAIQGPRSPELIGLLLGSNFAQPPRNEIAVLDGEWAGGFLARTGYTGEDGFELFVPKEKGVSAWSKLLELGQSLEIRPCGLGARDTLRLEVCYPLNGSDLSPEHTPLEAGLGFFVDLNKPEFIGREALAAQKAAGLSRKLTPFRMTDKSPPPRAHYPVFHSGNQISEVASGTLAPSLNAGIGMAYLPAELAKPGTPIEIDIRGRKFAAVTEKKPFYRK